MTELNLRSRDVAVSTGRNVAEVASETNNHLCPVAEMETNQHDSDSEYIPEIDGTPGNQSYSQVDNSTETGRWMRGTTVIRNHQVSFLKDKHTGLYKCALCNYKSSYRSSLRSHFASHSTDRPYGCDFCEYKAKRSSDLRKHKILKHGKGSVTPRGYQAYHTSGALMRSYESRSASKGTTTNDYAEVNQQQNDTSFDQQQEQPQPQPPTTTTAELGGKPNRDFPRAVFPGQDLQEMLIDCEAEELKSAAQEKDVYVKAEPLDTYASAHQAGVPPKEPEEFESDELQKLLQSVNVDNTEPEKLHTNSAATTTAAAGVVANDDDDSSLLSAGSNDTSPGQQKHHQSLQTRNISGRCLYPASNSQRIPSPTIEQQRHSPAVDCFQLQSTESSPNSVLSTFQANSVAVKTKQSFQCSYCNIIFFDGAVYCMHMGLHSNCHPWQCNLCGERLHDVYSFTSHFINGHNRQIYDD